jgi:hypothetical protein
MDVVSEDDSTEEQRMTDYVLAEINIARLLAPLDDPLIKEFVDNLERINGLAEQSPGFIWRLTGDGGTDATSIRPFDPMVIVNVSVWETVDALHHYTYSTAHTDFFRRRTEWFTKLGALSAALWWIPRDHRPDILEAKARLEHLWTHGPTPYAFTFKQRYTAAEALTATEQQT